MTAPPAVRGPDPQPNSPQPSAPGARPDWLPVTPENLDTLVDAVDQIAAVLPAGHEVFTAIYDRTGRASDLIVRDQHGNTRVVLGLSEMQHERLGPMLALVRDSLNDAAAHAEADAMVPVPLRNHPDSHEFWYRTILEESPVPLIVVRDDGTIDYASRAVVPTLGMPDPAQLSGTPFADLLHPTDRERLARIALRGLASRTITVRLRRWDGGYIAADAAARIMPDRQRVILALHPSATNRQGFEEVLHAERRQQALANAADCGTALINSGGDAFGFILECNTVFSRVLRCFTGDMAGRPVWELVATADEDRLRDALRRVADGGGSQTVALRLAKDVHRRVEFVINVDRSSGDPPAQLTVRTRDITDQHGHLAELQRAVDRLERDNRELSEFARTTSHDLMSPLRAISGLVDLLAPTLDGASTDTLESVQNAIERMLAMVDSAMGFAAARSEGLRHEPVDLNRVFTHVQATLAADIAASDARVTSGDLPTVSGDEAQLERLLMCLLNNALAYSGDRPPNIQIRARQDGGMWRISVADQGIGVEPEARERIFELFERSARPGTGNTRSRGIGLATCRRIIEHHDGQIWVQQNVPQGSIFVFTLPSTH